MLIDWFTVGAQALNFFILVWLMKRFLYGPVLAAIDAREARIARQLGDADAKQKMAEAQRDDFQHKNERFDQQRAGLLTQAEAQADAARALLMDEARHAVDRSTTKRQEALDSEARGLDRAVGQLAREEIFEIARKALRDLACTDLESCMVSAFNRRLAAMDEASRSALGLAFESASQPPTVRSAFELTSALQVAIASTVKTVFGAGSLLRFETAPRLISGIELVAGGQKLSWNVADHLATLERRVADIVRVPVELSSSAAPTAAPAIEVALPTAAAA